MTDILKWSLGQEELPTIQKREPVSLVLREKSKKRDETMNDVLKWSMGDADPKVDPRPREDQPHHNVRERSKSQKREDQMNDVLKWDVAEEEVKTLPRRDALVQLLNENRSASQERKQKEG